MIYETLQLETQAKIDAIVSSIKEHLTIDGNLDIDLIMATLERLNAVKRQIKEEALKAEAMAAEEQRQKAFELGKAYVSSLNVGDNVSFIYGTSYSKQTVTLPLYKKGEATFQVIFPDSLLKNSSTKIRNIKYEKVIIPDCKA